MEFFRNVKGFFDSLVSKGATPDKRNPRLLIVSNRLPVSISKKPEGGWVIKEDLLSHTFEHLRQESGVEYVWIGWPGLEVPPQEEQTLANQLAEYRCAPLFLTRECSENYYNGFCKRTLWPLFNYQQVPKFSTELWEWYCKANEKFAEIVSELYNPGDIIFIQDYHLCLLPGILRAQLQDPAVIGFFIHSPFPTNEIFRILPVRDHLLRGILGADVVGFQTYNYSRHFLSSCQRILGLDADWRGVECEDGHHLTVGIYPVGIDPTFIKDIVSSPTVQKRVAELKQTYKGKAMLVERTRMDWMSGIPQKLQAFDEFLTCYPEWKEKVVLVQVCEQPSAEDVESESYLKLCSEINTLVGSINGKFATVDWEPVHLLQQRLSIEETYALFVASDAAVITPIRDGMNLTSQEFVICQEKTHNPIILSEFAGSAQSLGGCLLVNPYHKRKFSDAINDVLTMDEREKLLNHKCNYRYVTTHTSLKWARTILAELERVGNHARPHKLDMKEVTDLYKNSKKRLFLLDYDGTLTPLVKRPELAVPSEQVMQTLQTLSSNPQNLVFVISGRDRISLEKWLGHLSVGLSCEHGLFYRSPGEKEWNDMSAELDTSWKESVLRVLEDYTEKTPGSFIEQKEINVTWHYRNCDPEFAAVQARELVINLQTLSTKQPMDILPGKKAVEIRPHGCNKGSIVSKIISALQTPPDFIICMGDDKTDEDMFSVLGKQSNALCVSVGKKATAAPFCVNNQTEVLELLGALSSA